MKRILTSCMAVLLLVSMLAGCSAYKNPSKYISVPEKGQATISAKEIAEKLKEQIADILEDNREADYVEVTEEGATAQMGDQLSIFYTGTLNDKSVTLTDKEIAGMTNKSDEDPYDLVLGSDSFIGAYESEDHPENNNKGFEEQLVGAKKGDTVNVVVTFPDDYDTKALQGQVATFVVEVKTIARNIVNEDSTVSVEYAFEEIKDEEAKDETTDTETGDSTDTENTDDAVAAQDEADTAEGEDTTEDKTEDDKTEETKTAFADLFKSGKFSIDYTAEITGTFNDIFNIKDYSDKFTGKYVYYEETVTVTVPEDVAEKYKDYAGVEISLTFTIKEVTCLPEWNAEFIKEYTSEEYTTVADYEAFLEKTIKQDLAYDAILAATVVDEWPMKEVKDTYKTYVDTYVSEKLEGGSPSDYTASELKEILTDEVYADIYKNAASSAYAAVKERLLVEYLIEELDVEMSNKEYKEKRAEYYKEYQIYLQYYYGVTSEKALEQYYGKESLKLQFLTEKLYEVIVDYVTIVD